MLPVVGTPHAGRHTSVQQTMFRLHRHAPGVGFVQFVIGRIFNF